MTWFLKGFFLIFFAGNFRTHLVILLQARYNHALTYGSFCNT